jgi:isocitrate dehydrogenase
MTFDNNTLSETGEAITMAEDGEQVVPSQPIVMIHEKKGVDPDVWCAAQRVLDIAVEKAYAGERKIIWTKCETEQVEDSEEECLVGLSLDDSFSSSTSVIFSGSMMLGSMGWHEAAALVLAGVGDAIQDKVAPCDSELLGMKNVPISKFSDVVISHIEAHADADQYDELADKFHEEFEAGAEKTSEFAHKAMDKAREQLTAAGKFTEEQGHKLKAFLENDFSRVSQEMKAGAKEKLNPSRLGAGALSSMAKLLHKTGVALSSFADKADDALACKSGEITSAGKLKCNACSYEMHFKKTGRIPPCPKCHKTEFTKGY